MAFGLLYTASHIPVVNDICRRVLELCPVNTSSWALEGPAELQAWRCGDTPVEHPHTLAEMAVLYGVTVAALEELRERCRVWQWGEPIDNTPRLRVTVAALAATDLE